ncbi:NADPH:adrenodoxin oxidoreductase, mitochondrial [Aphelenchoides besseyi]|nr:NADPH:adrenodoxin oxidoreductase, mitochondrial [Aphelenchoides besseyi]
MFLILRHCNLTATFRCTSRSWLSTGPRIAVIGSGPAGLYSCSALLNRLPTCHLDVIDKSPVPYGLVQFGVAPDHAEMKRCANHFERMFDNNPDRLSLFCNVAVGSDLTYEELCQNYDVIVLAYGASRARQLELPEATPDHNCFSGYSFVSWYNGQPKETQTPDLSGRNAIVIGNGNVAIDCARILLSNAERFRYTDMCDSAYRSLSASQIERVQMLGRRGPIEASFTIKELRELLNLEGVSVHCDIHPSIVSQVEEMLNDQQLPRRQRRILELMLSKRKATLDGRSKRSGSIVFHRKPERIVLDPKTQRIHALRVRSSLVESEIHEMPCDLLIYAIGFTSSHLPGVPTNEDQQLRLHDWCRVDESRAHVYATGWCAQAGSGVIADTQRNAQLVADEIRADWDLGKIEMKPPISLDARALLRRSGVRYVSWRDWKYVDETERRIGAEVGKPREKINDVIEFLRKNPRK